MVAGGSTWTRQPTCHLLMLLAQSYGFMKSFSRSARHMSCERCTVYGGGVMVCAHHVHDDAKQCALEQKDDDPQGKVGTHDDACVLYVHSS